MEEIEITMPDQYACYGRYWPGAEGKGAVLYLHGIQSHGEWFEGSCEYLAKQGLAVLLPDRRGSGKNRNRRGHLASVRQLLEDVSCWRDWLIQRAGDVPLHLIGVSWGGKLAAVWAGKHPKQVATLTLAAPGIFSRLEPDRTTKLKVGLKLLGDDSSPLFDLPLGEASLFTDNPRRQEYICNDALSLRKVSARFLWVSRRLDALRKKNSNRLTEPVHLILAGKDRIIDNDRTRRWFDRLCSSKKTLTCFEAMAHTMEFEPDPGPYYEAMGKFVFS